MAPGVEVARVDSNTWSLGVRGFESTLSRSVLVLIDGRSVYTPLFAGVYWQVQDTLLEDIDRIEVIRGPGGTIWGANAVNAVINIITKRALETHGTLASTGGGNVDQGFFNFRYGAGNSKGFTRGPEFHPDHQQFDDWRMGQTGFRADWDAHNRDRLTLQGDVYYGDAGQRVQIASYSPPYSTNVQQNAELSGGNLLGRWERDLGSGSNVQLQTYYDRTNRKQANFAESRDTFDIDFIHHLILPGRQDFLWGLGARLSSGNASQVVPTVAFTPNHYTDKLYNAFVQDEIPIVGDQLSLTIGSKFLHNGYSGFEIEPTARLLWTPSSRQTVWGAVTRAVRTPSRVEEDLQLTGLAAPTPLTFFRVIGDRKFSSESPPPPPHTVIPFFFRNGLLGHTAGFEIAPDWTPTRIWRLRGSYSYLHIDLGKKASSLDTSSANSTQGSSPHHQVAIQSSLDLPKKLEFDQTFRYVSSLPAQLVGAYSTADVRFSWHATHSLDVSVVGENLFQPHHAEFGGDPGPLVGIKRSAYISLTWQSWQR